MAESYGGGLAAAGLQALVTTPEAAFVGGIRRLAGAIARLPGAGETVMGPSYALHPGGKGANQAVAAAKLGAEVIMLTKVGDDMFGENTIKNLKSVGIDTRHVGRVAGKSSGVAPIM
eukprot:gene17807-24860_t